MSNVANRLLLGALERKLQNVSNEYFNHPTANPGEWDDCMSLLAEMEGIRQEIYDIENFLWGQEHGMVWAQDALDEFNTLN